MAERSVPKSFTPADYLVRNREGQDDQIAGARLQFIEAVGSFVPAFLEQLRDQVYPEYARLADVNPEYWVMGSRFETWRLRSDPDNRFAPILMAWAQDFNVQGEDWILEGALQTLSYWHQFPRSRAALDIAGFRQWNGFKVLTSAEERRFEFSDEGWDPTFVSATGWRTKIRKRFESAIRAHERRMLKLVVERGAIPAVGKFSKEHFAWLALYQCGNLSLEAILLRAKNVGGKTTISKGIHNAAILAAMDVRPRRRKAKKP